ncbi:MAG: hypothetical protein U1D25_05500 [Hydrogenophaga sp.]|uniref:hypothetical protein n=1 Tax=Hydrogenophaga sp. TaxID=1904254 RepID=UPI0027451366|nr:hypothetical protein [Hydrogenophaga sp.]MDP2416352.1 hypothetical protein [Hydrogenophaga sp.]MDZ4187551.1 hypothetical protein [Hydrogenophaga sp.]
MYQELIVHIDSFDAPPVWGTEANDLPLPTLAVGDVLEVPGLAWHSPTKPHPVFRVTAVKHVFTDTGPGPEANHQLMVTVAADGSPTQEDELNDALAEAEQHQRHSAFWRSLLKDVARQRAPALMDAVLQGIQQAMQSRPAHGIEAADNEWLEAARILQADGHGLADILRSTLGGSVYEAIKALPREERLVLWLAQSGFDEEWEDSADPRDFEPDGRSDALNQLEDELLSQLQTELLYTALD